MYHWRVEVESYLSYTYLYRLSTLPPCDNLVPVELKSLCDSVTWRRHPQLLNIEPFSQICCAKFLTIFPESGSHKGLQVSYMVVILSPKLKHFLSHSGGQLPVHGGRAHGQWPLLWQHYARMRVETFLGLLKVEQPRASIYRHSNLNVCIIEISKRIYCPYIFGNNIGSTMSSCFIHAGMRNYG